MKRLLTARFELGEMDEQPAWSEIPASVLNSKEHQALALRMARESLVLLQNKNNILPLNTNLKVAVMGPNANDSVMQWGNYNGIPAHTVTLLEAVRAKLPEGQIIYEPGCDRVDGKTLQSLFDECSIMVNPVSWQNIGIIVIVKGKWLLPIRFPLRSILRQQGLLHLRPVWK